MPPKRVGKVISNFISGINEYPEGLTNANELVVAKNVDVSDGVIRKRKGYKKYISSLLPTRPLAVYCLRLPGYSDKLIFTFPSPYGIQIWEDKWTDITPLTGWTATKDDRVSMVTYFDHLIIANGKDKLVSYIPTDERAVTIEDAPIAKYVTGYKDYVFAGNMLDGGYTCVNRIRWCKPGNYLDWTTGGAGYKEIDPDAGDEINGLAPGLVFKKRKIHALTPAGTAIWSYRDVAVDLGLEAADSPIGLVDRCYFYSNRGFAVTDMSQAKIISQKINQSASRVNAANKNKAFGFHLQDTDTLFFGVDSTGDGNNDTIFGYNIVNESWVKHTFGDPPISMIYGAFGKEDLTWDNIPEEWGWEDCDWFWESPPLDIGMLQSLFVGPQYIYMYGIGYSDDGKDIESRIKTKEIVDDILYKKLLHYVYIWYEATPGVSLDIKLRIDGRDDVTMQKTITLSALRGNESKLQETRILLNVPYSTFSLEVSNKSQLDYAIHSIGYEYSIRGRNLDASKPTWGVSE